MELLAMAALSLFAGFVISGVSEQTNSKQAKKEKERAEERLGLEKQDQLDLLNLKYEQSKADEQLQYEQDIANLDNAYETSKAKAELEFRLNKQEANRNADITDLTMNNAERDTSAEFNAQIDQLYLMQLFQGAEYTSAAADAGRQQGQALNAAAASGVRSGSSLSQAIELESATNAEQLQMRQDMQRRSDQMNIDAAVRGLGNARFGIGQNRDNADYTRAMFEAGGSEFEKNKNYLDTLKGNYELSTSQRNASYLRRLDEMEKLNTQYQTNINNEYERNMTKLKNDYGDYVSGEQTANRILTGMFDYGNKAFKTAVSFKQTANFVF